MAFDDATDHSTPRVTSETSPRGGDRDKLDQR